MRLYMFHRSGLDQEELRNSNGVGGVLVLAENADEAEARLKAQDAATSGETTVYADWQATLLAGDATRLVFEDGAFGHVYSFHVLEHIPDYPAALGEMRRVLKNGGSYLIGTPNRARLIGYLGSKHLRSRAKLNANVEDWKMRLKGRFRNEYGAHAGFTSRELRRALEAVFSTCEDVSNRYYLRLYARYRWLIVLLIVTGLKRFLFPSVYFVGRR